MVTKIKTLEHQMDFDIWLIENKTLLKKLPIEHKSFIFLKFLEKLTENLELFERYQKHFTSITKRIIYENLISEAMNSSPYYKYMDLILKILENYVSRIGIDECFMSFLLSFYKKIPLKKIKNKKLFKICKTLKNNRISDDQELLEIFKRTMLYFIKYFNAIQVNKDIIKLLYIFEDDEEFVKNICKAFEYRLFEKKDHPFFICDFLYHMPDKIFKQVIKYIKNKDKDTLINIFNVMVWDYGEIDNKIRYLFKELYPEELVPFVKIYKNTELYIRLKLIFLIIQKFDNNFYIEIKFPNQPDIKFSILSLLLIYSKKNAELLLNKKIKNYKEILSLVKRNNVLMMDPLIRITKEIIQGKFKDIRFIIKTNDNHIFINNIPLKNGLREKLKENYKEFFEILISYIQPSISVQELDKDLLNKLKSYTNTLCKETDITNQELMTIMVRNILYQGTTHLNYILPLEEKINNHCIQFVIPITEVCYCIINKGDNNTSLVKSLEYFENTKVCRVIKISKKGKNYIFSDISIENFTKELSRTKIEDYLASFKFKLFIKL